MTGETQASKIDLLKKFSRSGQTEVISHSHSSSGDGRNLVNEVFKRSLYCKQFNDNMLNESSINIVKPHIPRN